MSGFSFNGPSATDAAPQVVTNDGWLPDVDPAAVKDEQRIPESITGPRLRAAIVAAIITVGNELTDWQARQLAAGFRSLADVPAPKIDGQSRNVLLYQRAVAAYAKADLVERYRDVDFTGAGQRDADAVQPSIGELRRDAIHAVRDILGRARTDVELI
nr:head completion/stabilization protein [uncultured Sphingomonas sp.]